MSLHLGSGIHTLHPIEPYDTYPDFSPDGMQEEDYRTRTNYSLMSHQNWNYTTHSGPSRTHYDHHFLDRPGPLVSSDIDGQEISPASLTPAEPSSQDCMRSSEHEHLLSSDDLEVDGAEEETRQKILLCDGDYVHDTQEYGPAFRVRASDINPVLQVKKRPVSKVTLDLNDFAAEKYNSSHVHRGRCLIISNSEFHNKNDRPERKGSLRDARALEKKFQELGFHPVRCSNGSEEMIHQNLSRQELLHLITEATDPSLNDHTDYDCFVCVILSYGIEGVVMCADEEEDMFLETDAILEHFKPQNCPSLALKPKVFLIQGSPPYDICQTMGASVGIPSEPFSPKVTSLLPSQSDIIVQFSGVHASLGWGRNWRRGLSYYVQALCECLEKFCISRLKQNRRSLEFFSFLTRVNHTFAYILEDDDIDVDEEYCAPCVRSTLTKSMYFYAKPPSEDVDMDTG